MKKESICNIVCVFIAIFSWVELTLFNLDTPSHHLMRAYCDPATEKETPTCRTKQRENGQINFSYPATSDSTWTHSISAGNVYGTITSSHLQTVFSHSKNYRGRRTIHLFSGLLEKVASCLPYISFRVQSPVVI